MEGSFSGTLEGTQKVESQSEDKEVIDEGVKSIFDLGGEVAADDKSRSISETQDGDGSTADNSTIMDEEAKENEGNRQIVYSGEVEEAEEVSESVVDSLEPIVSSAKDSIDAIKAPVDKIQASDDKEYESKEKKEKDFLSPEDTDEGIKGLDGTELPPSEENNELASAAANMGLRETEEVEAIQDFTDAEENKVTSLEEKNVLSSFVTDEEMRERGETKLLSSGKNIGSSLPPTDVVSKMTEETTFTKPDASDKVPPTITEAVLKGVEDSRLPATDKKVGEQSVVLESSKEKVDESLQPWPNVPADETTGAPLQHKTDIPRSTENPSIISVTQRQHTSWSSCCGLLEILSRDDK